MLLFFLYQLINFTRFVPKYIGPNMYLLGYKHRSHNFKNHMFVSS